MGVRGIGHRTWWKIQTIRLSEEDLKRLEEIGRKKYRISSRAGIIRLLIEDGWKEIQRDEQNKS